MSNFEPTLEEVVRVVADINDNMPEDLFDLGITPLTVVCVSYYDVYVKAFGSVIWDNDNDDRDYLLDGDMKETNEKEDLYCYLKYKTERICKLILGGLDVY